ncbi:MAG: hypothetical protein WBD56_15230 [Anaerolineales bacterium]
MSAHDHLDGEGLRRFLVCLPGAVVDQLESRLTAVHGLKAQGLYTSSADGVGLRLEFRFPYLPQDLLIQFRRLPRVAGGRVALQADDQRLPGIKLDLAAVVSRVQLDLFCWATGAQCCQQQTKNYSDSKYL